MSNSSSHKDTEKFWPIESLLVASAWIAYARFSRDGVLVRANPRFLDVCGECDGRLLPDLVAEGQRDEMGRILRGDELAGEQHNVHFISGSDSPTSLLVRWVWESDELVMIGEPPIADTQSTMTTLVKLNGRVSDLARENAKKSAQLAQALDDLREAQSMLVHREKMAALGRMTAGVAHEINNPLSYAKNNLYLLDQSLEGLLELFGLLGEGLDSIEASEPELFEVIMDKSETIGLPHLAERLPELVAAADAGIERASRLVDSLRTFSRIDEAEVKAIDLNESLRSVVEFAGFMLKDTDTDLMIDFDDVPTVTCSPGELNQAILNILTNAVQASAPRGEVSLSTRVSDGEVLITVADNGPGVPEGLKERIFDPFFTTREVGEGTGLGLSNANAVITAQGGSISVDDAIGGGAVFTVHLPLDKDAML